MDMSYEWKYCRKVFNKFDSASILILNQYPNTWIVKEHWFNRTTENMGGGGGGGGGGKPYFFKQQTNTVSVTGNWFFF